MGCNHPLLYMTHGKSGRNTALKAVAVAKSSHVATVVWSLVKREWKSWGEWVLRITRIFFCSEITIFPLYHYPQTGEGCAVCQVSPVPLDHACSDSSICFCFTGIFWQHDSVPAMCVILACFCAGSAINLRRISTQLCSKCLHDVLLFTLLWVCVSTHFLYAPGDTCTVSWVVGSFFSWQKVSRREQLQLACSICSSC